jgi:two-component system, sensor histidine kinase LadS
MSLPLRALMLLRHVRLRDYRAPVLARMQAIQQALLALLCFACALCMSTLPADAQAASVFTSKNIVLTPTTHHVDLSLQAARWLDAPTQADLAEAQRQYARGQFKPAPGLPAAGYSLSAQWIRVVVAPQALARSDWILHIGMPMLNDVQVWAASPDGRWQHHQRGDRFTQQALPFAARGFAMRLNLPAGQPSEIWVRVQSTSIMSVSLDLWQPEAYAGHEALFGLAHNGLVTLLALVMVVFALLGLGMKDRVLLTFALTMTAVVVNQFCSGGTLLLVWPERPWWAADILVGYGVLGTWAMSCFLWVEVLEMRQNHPRVARMLAASAWIVLAMLPFSATNLFPTLASTIYLLAAPLGVFILKGMVTLSRQRQDATIWLYTASFVAGTLGFWALVAVGTGLLPRTNWSNSLQPMCIGLMSTLMSAAMILRIIRIQHDKHAAEQASELAMLRMSNQRRFVAMLTHEFRNPLAGIDRSANLLQAMPDQSAENVNKRLGGIRTQVSRLNTLVDSFLMAESAETLALQPNLTLVTMADYLHERQQAISHEQQARVRTETQPPSLTARIDKRLLSLAVQNLLDNALRYAPHDTPVTLRAYEESTGEKRWLRLEVSDQGPGVPEAELAMLGTPYYRATTALGHQGTGLGYHFCQQIAQAHGGSMNAHNREGGGLVVVLQLPQ